MESPKFAVENLPIVFRYLLSWTDKPVTPVNICETFNEILSLNAQVTSSQEEMKKDGAARPSLDLKASTAQEKARQLSEQTGDASGWFTVYEAMLWRKIEVAQTST